jgi:flagellar biosynthetic protein FliP
MKTLRLPHLALVVCLGSIIFFPHSVFADVSSPSITINTSSNGELTNSEVYAGLKLATLLWLLAFLPSLIMALTCFTRIAVVLSLTRQALGTAQVPPSQVLLGLALFLTFSIMSPIFTQIYNEAAVPYMEDQITNEQALDKAFAPLRTFMLQHTREQDLELFIEVTKTEIPDDVENLGPAVVVPAFLISELNSAFQIGFLIFLPFLILDMIISSVLTSMSMITLPPTVISLPIKLMLFVVIDGWNLIIGNLIKSYTV